MFAKFLGMILFRPGTTEPSKTKLATLGALATGLATVWGFDLDPRILQTLGLLTGSGIIAGIRDAQD